MSSVHPILSRRRSLVAYLTVWLGLSYIPASLLASPHGSGILVAMAVAAPPTLLLGLCVLPIYHLCRALPLRPASSSRVFRLQLALALVWSLVWLALLELAVRLADWAGPAALTREIEPRRGLLLALGAMFYFAVVAFHYLVLGTQRARASEKRAAAASLQAREAQLALLKAQVHPHFLFNSLNAISALTVDNPGRARELCILLADFLRGSLAMGERGMVSLSDELQLARTYLDIEKFRLGDRLTVDIQVSPPAGDVRVPALLLQPLVENAITHGIATCAQGGTLSLVARTTPAMLVVAVSNPFDPQAPPRRGRGPGSSGLGLANVSRRVSACYDRGGLTIQRDLDRFTATLNLPADIKETPHGERARISDQSPHR